MNRFYADLHIHIGRDSRGRPVKITASRRSTFFNILKEARERKGIDIVGIVDCASPGVISDIKSLLERGLLAELDGGGLIYDNTTVIFTGSEVELQGPGGPGHFLAFFPSLDRLEDYSREMSVYITNLQLSSQVARISPRDWFDLVRSLDGLIIVAHAFTPHKSLYGSMADSFFEIQKEDVIAALELGLSADSFLASMIAETTRWPYLSNSDAHSPEKIGREYNILKLEKPNFEEFKMALKNKNGRSIVGNFGLDPGLGKYHRTFCLKCQRVVGKKPPALTCDRCGSSDVVRGVLDRIAVLSGIDNPLDYYEKLKSQKYNPQNKKKLNYNYQIPLEMVPGVGKKTLDKLITSFGSEMAVLHQVSRDSLKEVIRSDLAEKIVLAREGKIRISAGGGGHYGKVVQ